jgi:hypothetical protein
MSQRIAVTSRLGTGAMLLLGLVAGCNNSSNPTPTAPGVQSQFNPAPGPYTISGVVNDNGQPIANADVNASVESGGAGYRYSSAHGSAQTDASGRYRLTGLQAGAQVWVQLNASGYVQPCAASAIISGDSTLDIALVSIANLTASPMPSPPGLRSVSGTVVEMTATGSQPVAGALLTAEAGDNGSIAPDENPAAYTYSDAAGRFALCGLPANDPVFLEAALYGGFRTLSADVTVAPGQTSNIQITLPSSMSTTMALRPREIATIR